MLHFSTHMVQVAAPLALKDHFSTHEDKGYDWNIPLDDMIRSVAYAAFLVVVMMIVALIVKLLATLVGGGDNDGPGIEETSETDSLLPKEAGSSLFSYGACDQQEDVECGKSSSYCNTSSFHDDLYDGTICVICFDNKRNSFFVPCGHCVACCTCADRILEGETKTCPICRRLIQKVSKLFVS